MSQYESHHEVAEKLLREAVDQAQEGETAEVRLAIGLAQVEATLAQAETIQEVVTMLDDLRGGVGYIGGELSELVKQVRR